MKFSDSGTESTLFRYSSGSQLRELFEPIYLNPDNITGMSAPWETTKRYRYWVQEKTGALVGFSSIVSMIPELRLGLAVFANSPGPSNLWTAKAHEILIPALESLLAPVQPPPQAVRRPELYLGSYSMAPGSSAPGLAAEISRAPGEQDVLVIQFLGSSSLLVPQDAVDAGRNATYLQLHIPPQYQGCQLQEVLGTKMQAMSDQD